MIPVRDVIPSRTAPGVTLALLAALGAAFLSPAVREWWLPWAADGLVVWLTGGTLEDRLGHARFGIFAAACAGAAAAAPAVLGHPPGLVWAACGTAAGFIAAYVLMFPRSRVLMLVPVVVGLEVADVPAWVVFAPWAFLQGAAAWSALAALVPADMLGMAASVAGGALAGALGSLLLRRPERMRVEWWDPPRS
jgi:membrane associated rhomboid family serine protease